MQCPVEHENLVGKHFCSLCECSLQAPEPPVDGAAHHHRDGPGPLGSVVAAAANEVVPFIAGLVERLTSPGHPSPGDKLSGREVTILHLLNYGLSERGIGEELHVSLGMVRAHIGGIITKLGAVSTADAISRARRSGLI